MYIIQISSFQTTKGVDKYKKYRKVDRIITFARYYFKVYIYIGGPQFLVLCLQ